MFLFLFVIKKGLHLCVIQFYITYFNTIVQSRLHASQKHALEKLKKFKYKFIGHRWYEIFNQSW